MASESPWPQALNGRADFDAAVRALILALPESDGREAWLVDADLCEWPLGEPEVLDALTRWLRRPGRRLNLLALQFENLAKRQPRFASWRANFAHALESRTPQELQADDMPCLLLAPPSLLRLHDRIHWRGLVGQERADLQRGREQIAAISQRSSLSWPVWHLGL